MVNAIIILALCINLLRLHWTIHSWDPARMIPTDIRSLWRTENRWTLPCNECACSIRTELVSTLTMNVGDTMVWVVLASAIRTQDGSVSWTKTQGGTLIEFLDTTAIRAAYMRQWTEWFRSSVADVFVDGQEEQRWIKSGVIEGYWAVCSGNCIARRSEGWINVIEVIRFIMNLQVIARARKEEMSADTNEFVSRSQLSYTTLLECSTCIYITSVDIDIQIASHAFFNRLRECIVWRGVEILEIKIVLIVAF